MKVLFSGGKKLKCISCGVESVEEGRKQNWGKKGGYGSRYRRNFP